MGFILSSIVIALISFFLTKTIGKFSISSACYKSEDAVLKYIKPSADGGVIPVICSKGFTMIDLGLNSDAISEYFSSFQNFNSFPASNGDDVLTYGPGCNDWVSWRDFWTPATADTKFRIADSCNTCKNSILSVYDENVAYYMSDYFIALASSSDNLCARDEVTNEPYSYTYDTTDKTTSMCNICDLNSYGETVSTDYSDCAALQLSADTVADHSDHDTLLQDEWFVVQPSMAGDRSYCTCYQPLMKEITTYMVEKHELPKVSFEYKEYSSAWTVDTHIIWDAEESDANDCFKKYYLSSTDFMDGTLKIKVCGEYILTEDISISFNAPSAEIQASDDFSPNSIDVEDLYWYPTTAQQESGSNEYTGSDSFHGIYQFGFFAGISIQTDDVTINLNGFKIEMEMKYYLQQRFFAIIELSNRNFVSNGGPSQDLGKEVIKISNIVIKDGAIGRASHHGIHGNGASNVHISNVIVSNFDIAGIQCNGCTNIRITDVVVGPQSYIPVVGRYLHSRALIPRLRHFVDLFGDEVIPFGDHNPHKESKTVSELVDNIITQMDLIYFHAINGVVRDEKDKDWIAAQSLYLNKDGYQDTGSVYGILINGYGSGVLAFGRRIDKASDIVLENVEIFGIAISVEERFNTDPKMQGFFFDNFDWLAITNGGDGRYIGDAYTDIVFAANELMTEYCFLNTLLVSPLRDWVFTDDQSVVVMKAGGTDVQAHDAKGAMGLRVDQTTDITVTNLYVHDIINHGVLGNTKCCGQWSVKNFINHVHIDIEPGYTATRAHGVLLDFVEGSFTDIVVKHIESHYGSAIGMSFYKGTEINKLENVQITNIYAGSKLSQKDALALTLPNMVPFVCSVEFGVNTDVPDYYPISIKQMDEDSIVGYNINGYDVCEGDRLVGSIVNDEQKENTKYGSSGVMVYLHNALLLHYYGWMSVLLVLLSILCVTYYFVRCRKSGNVKEKRKSYGAINFYSDI